jgi:hypothetical protein
MQNYYILILKKDTNIIRKINIYLHQFGVTYTIKLKLHCILIFIKKAKNTQFLERGKNAKIFQFIL